MDSDLFYITYYHLQLYKNNINNNSHNESPNIKSSFSDHVRHWFPCVGVKSSVIDIKV